VSPIKVVAPAPAGVTCSSSPLTVRGCQTLVYTYASAATASGSTLGDYLGRVKRLDYTAWNPATSGGRPGSRRSSVVAVIRCAPARGPGMHGDSKASGASGTAYPPRTLVSFDVDAVVDLRWAQVLTGCDRGGAGLAVPDAEDRGVRWSLDGGRRAVGGSVSVDVYVNISSM